MAGALVGSMWLTWLEKETREFADFLEPTELACLFVKFLLALDT